MHIPTSLLHGPICPVTAAVSLFGVSAAVFVYHKSTTKGSELEWAGVSALIFAMQTLNFSVSQGTSGHLLGGVLAARLLGIPRAIISMALVLFVQAVFFADGGLSTLGANVLNMSLIGAGVGGLLLKFFEKQNLSQNYALASASFLSVIIAALVCTLEVAGSGMMAMGAMAKSMLSVHALIGVGEAILTVVMSKVLLRIFKADHDNIIVMRTLLCGLAIFAIFPWASRLPDGLEWTVQQLNLVYSNPVSVFNFDQLGISTFAAQVMGFAVVWFCTMGMAKKYDFVSR